MKKLKVIQYDINEVDEITLLSIEEAKRVPRNILFSQENWWLKSCGHCLCTSAYVYDDGSISEFGFFVYSDYNAVRPAFRINYLNSKIGEKILVGNTWCTVVAVDLALTDYSICHHRFDASSNVWETSELRKFINSDEFKAMI